MTIRKKTKAAITSFSVAALLLGGSVVVAAPAQAMSYGQCENVYTPKGAFVGRYIYVSYNWWEKFIQGKHPGFVLEQGRRC